MVKSKIMSVIGAGIMLSGIAHAESAGYIGGGLALLEYSEADINDDASLKALFVRIGSNINQNFSAEIRAGVGVGDDTVNVFGTNVDVELDNMFGVYVRGGIPLSNSVFPYAIIGYTSGKVTASAAGYGSATESESDMSFGLGVDIPVSKYMHLNAEYMNYFDKDGAEIGGIAIGFINAF